MSHFKCLRIIKKKKVGNNKTNHDLKRGTNMTRWCREASEQMETLNGLQDIRSVLL
jgi:hypothetical protein